MVSKMGSKSSPKSLQQNVKNDAKNVQIWTAKFVPIIVQSEIATLRHFLPRRHFWGFFVAYFDLGFCRFLGASWASLGSLGWLMDPKTFKNFCFFKVFKDAAFWLFKALDGPLGPILPPSWADLVPKWAPKWAPKVVQKIAKKLFKK